MYGTENIKKREKEVRKVEKSDDIYIETKSVTMKSKTR
jgi:hypothetical protein